MSRKSKEKDSAKYPKVPHHRAKHFSTDLKTSKEEEISQLSSGAAGEVHQKGFERFNRDHLYAYHFHGGVVDRRVHEAHAALLHAVAHGLKL